MKNGILGLSWVNVKSALVYAFLIFLSEAIIFIVHQGTIFGINWKELIDVSIIPVGVFVISIIKNLLTTNSGSFLGIIKVIPPTE